MGRSRNEFSQTCVYMAQRWFATRLVALLASASAFAQGTIGDFPKVAFPTRNPSTPAKVLLGKALFFEEQLSSDNTMSCATCHLPEAGGAELRTAVREPGDDGVLGTLDDNLGSPGMIRQNASRSYAHHPIYGVAPQATNRNVPSVIGAAFFRALFWDLRAGPVFRDEQGNVVLAENAALESQAVGPPTSSVEMAHEGIHWSQVTAKLGTARPLRLARDIPSDLASFIGSSLDYRPLFSAAFGSSEVTRERVAMAIATYERTLVPDQAPFDRGTMSPQQQRGFDVFRSKGNCTACHTVTNRLFSDGRLHSIVLPNHVRPVKAPSLRNVGLRRRFMHSGQFTDLEQVVRHYEGLRFFAPLTDAERQAVLAFLGNALTDPRIVLKQAPFDRPTLHSELHRLGSNHYRLGSPGSGGFVPVMLAGSPANIGNADFKIGVGSALGGSIAILGMSAGATPPGTHVNGIPLHIDPFRAHFDLAPLSGSGAGKGVATMQAPLPDDVGLLGIQAAVQWFVADPNAIGGFAATPAAVFAVFGGEKVR